MPGQVADSAMKTGTGEVVPAHTHMFADTPGQVVMIQIEAIPSHDIGVIATIPGVAHDTQIPHTGVIAINPTMTHHINLTADHLHTEAHHHTTPKTEVAHVHIHHTNPQDKIHIGHTHTPSDCIANHI